MGLTPARGGFDKGNQTFTERCRKLQHLLQLVVDKLNLGSDNDLASGLAGADNAGSTSSLDGLLVDSSAVLDLEAQTSGAVVNVGNIVLAADSSQNAGGDGGEVVVGEGDVGLSSLGILVLTAGGLQVELDDSELEDQIEDNESGDAQRMIIQVLACAGRLAEKIRSVAPAEKQKPARKPE